MISNDPMQPDVIQAVREFNQLASVLAMPVSERRSILGLPPIEARSPKVIDIVAPSPTPPDFLRRLNYVLPLMRRMADAEPAELMAG